MDIDLVIKLAGIGVCAVIICSLLKAFNPSYSLYVSVACGVVLMYYALRLYTPVLEYIVKAAGNNGTFEYTKVVIRLCAIGIVTGFASDICTDAGERTIGNKIELIGKAAASLTVLPVLINIINSVKSFIG